MRPLSWSNLVYEPLASNCGSNAASACGLDSRLARRLRVRFANLRIVLQGALINGNQVGGIGRGRGEDQTASGDDERSAYFHLVRSNPSGFAE